MEIKIGYDFNKNKIIKENKENNLHNDNEYEILNNILNMLSDKFNKSDFKIVSNTNDYLTLQYCSVDIARVKYTNKTQWLSIVVIGENKKKYKENALFDKETNKNKVQWKSKYDESKLNIYVEILEESLVLMK